jgi:hypothetical protein
MKLIAVRREGHSRVITVTKILPDTWEFVTYKIERSSATKIVVSFQQAQ